jgi:hypothetical protein
MVSAVSGAIAASNARPRSLAAASVATPTLGEMVARLGGYTGKISSPGSRLPQPPRSEMNRQTLSEEGRYRSAQQRKPIW